MKPPLRRGRDVDALWANLDVIDMIATDHAPHTRDEKAGAHPPFGVPGLETALPLMLTAVHAGKLTMHRVVEMMHTAPARIFRLPSQPETYVEIDPQRRWCISSDHLYTRAGWTPFEGMTVMGAVASVTLRGREVVRDGVVLAEPGWGFIMKPLA